MQVVGSRGYVALRQLFNTKTTTLLPFRYLAHKSNRSQEIKFNDSVTPPTLYDQIGPAHAVSNIRPVKFYKPDNESKLHQKYRLLREETIEWNQDFWAKHNKEFAEAREKFITKVCADNHPKELKKRTISSEEMSEFYKSFLDAKWSSHLQYNIEWQKRNFRIAALSIVVAIENIFRPKM